MRHKFCEFFCLWLLASKSEPVSSFIDLLLARLRKFLPDLEDTLSSIMPFLRDGYMVNTAFPTYTVKQFMHA